MRALHGLLTETEAAEPDDSWKLPPEKRKALDELFGEEEVVRLEPDTETRIRRSGRRALLAIAACVMLTLFLGAVFSAGSASIQKARKVKQAAQYSAAEEKFDFLPGGAGGGGGMKAQKSAAPIEFADGGNSAGAHTRSKGIKDESRRLGGAVQKQIRNGMTHSFDGLVNDVPPAVAAAPPASPAATPTPTAATQILESAPAAAGGRTRMLSSSERAINELGDRSAVGNEELYAEKPASESNGESTSSSSFYDGKPAAQSAPGDGKSDLAAADGARWSSRDENTARPERPRVAPPGAKSKPAESNVEASGAIADVDHDSRFSRKPMDSREIDGSKPNGSASTPAYGDVVDSLLSSAPGQPKSSADSPASGPVSEKLAMKVEELKNSESATGAGGGGGAGTAFGLAKREGAEFKEKSSMDKRRDGSWSEEAAKQRQSETAAATGVTAGDLDARGAVDAPAAAGTFALNGGIVGGEIPAKLGYQMNLSDSESDMSLGAPEIQVPEDGMQELSEGVTAVLRHGDQAISSNNIDAILSNPNKPMGGAATDSFAAEAQQASAPSDDLIRNSAALTQTGEGDKVRRGLYMGEGNLNLGNYDQAKTEYEKVLQDEPDNSAARQGLEKVEAATTNYYRAANDQTRAELLMQVDKAWELKVPAEVKGDKDGPDEAKPLEIAFEKAKAAPAKKSPLESIEEIAASEEAYSTFSLNINDASFQIAKAALEKGERPDPAAIKVEQFYNAVDYGDSAPATNEPVAARIEQAAHPIIPGRNLVRVSLKTAAAGRGASQPLRLTLLVDQSGSMVREDRRTAMSNALKQLSVLLTPNDHITVVGFSRESHLLADNWTGDKAGKLGDLVNQTASEGGTNLEQAINLGEQMAARPHPAGEQNRIVLFTDGAANLGNANPERLAERVKSLRQQGIAFDIAGIGADGVNDRLLSELARNGNGRYYVVGDSKNESFARQLAGAFRPAAENVKVQVNFNPERVGRYKLIGFEKDRLKTEDFRNDAVDAAELAAEEAGVAIYQVETLPQGSGEIGEVSVRFRDTSKGEMVERKWTMPFESTIQAFDRATPSMQLAGLSMLAAEKLKGGPLADAIDFRQLSGSQSLVKQFYGSSPRVADMLHVIDLLK